MVCGGSRDKPHYSVYQERPHEGRGLSRDWRKGGMNKQGPGIGRPVMEEGAVVQKADLCSIKGDLGSMQSERQLGARS